MLWNLRNRHRRSSYNFKYKKWKHSDNILRKLTIRLLKLHHWFIFELKLHIFYNSLQHIRFRIPIWWYIKCSYWNMRSIHSKWRNYKLLFGWRLLQILLYSRQALLYNKLHRTSWNYYRRSNFSNLLEQRYNSHHLYKLKQCRCFELYH